MSSSWKRILNITGGALGLLGIAFVAVRLRSYAEKIEFGQFSVSAWFLILLLCLIYGGGNLFLAKAWNQLLLYFNLSIEGRQSVRIYGLSQLAKYVPGNIFHLAGRQALGGAAGLPAKKLAKSTLWELGLMAVAGGLFSPLVIPLLWGSVSSLLAAGGFFCILSISLWLLRKFLSARVSYALLWHCFFLAVSGVTFVVLVFLISKGSFSSLPVTALCGAYVISWLAGFVTPGAPAGVGVRELVLLFLLKGVVVEADLLLAVVLGRMVTVVGDVLFFLAVLLMRSSASSGS